MIVHGELRRRRVADGHYLHIAAANGGVTDADDVKRVAAVREDDGGREFMHASVIVVPQRIGVDFELDITLASVTTGGSDTSDDFARRERVVLERFFGENDNGYLEVRVGALSTGVRAVLVLGELARSDLLTAASVKHCDGGAGGVNEEARGTNRRGQAVADKLERSGAGELPDLGVEE